MCSSRSVSACCSYLVFFFAAIGDLTEAQTEVLKVYGPTSPVPAMTEAAAVFQRRENVKVELVPGPIEFWSQAAAKDADLIYATADFMMSRFLRTEEFQLDPASVTSLYMRPSAILVRPNNPKKIRDFPDLLNPGVRVMVVTGSGQTALWEDMAGKLGDVRALRTLRANIVLFARNSDEAARAWKERNDIDAWITWNIWFMPLRDRANLVPVSREYRIFRQASIAITQRGKTKPAAAKFVELLTSQEGAQIFTSWGWTPPPSDSNPLAVHTDICVVCRIDSDTWKGGIGAGLAHIRQLLEDYDSLGIPASEVHISAVFHGEAAYWLLNDAAYSRAKKVASGNPNSDMVRELIRLGVGIELCGQTIKEHGWTNGDILPGVRIVPGAYTRIIDLEQQGYAYLRF